MKHAKRFTSFLAGMLTALLLVGMITPALAVGLSRRIEVSSGVSIYVDDVKLNPRDANGNPVEVFIYNGTTYLPVRAVSEALEVPVQWDGSTRSVYLGKHTGDKPAVWLADMDYFSGTSSRNLKIAASEKDNMGDTHRHCITNNMYRTYNINGQYSRLTGVLYQKYDYRSGSIFSPDDRTAGLQVYGDGELLYDCQYSHGETGIKPANFDISLSGVLELEIVFVCNRGSSADILSLGDVGLWT